MIPFQLSPVDTRKSVRKAMPKFSKVACRLMPSQGFSSLHTGSREALGPARGQTLRSPPRAVPPASSQVPHRDPRGARRLSTARDTGAGEGYQLGLRVRAPAFPPPKNQWLKQDGWGGHQPLMEPTFWS